MSAADPKAKLEALQAVFVALAHPARRQILLAIHFRGGAMTAGQIAGRFAHAWPTTTRHLRVLEAARLVRQERRGRERRYQIDRALLALISEWLEWFHRPGGAGAVDERPPARGRGKKKETR